MNYIKIHDLIISKAISENRKKQIGDGLEFHHIIPKRLGGKETVLLTGKEHFLCHKLMHTIDPKKYKMISRKRPLSLYSTPKLSLYSTP